MAIFRNGGVAALEKQLHAEQARLEALEIRESELKKRHVSAGTERRALLLADQVDEAKAVKSDRTIRDLDAALEGVGDAVLAQRNMVAALHLQIGDEKARIAREAEAKRIEGLITQLEASHAGVIKPLGALVEALHSCGNPDAEAAAQFLANIVAQIDAEAPKIAGIMRSQAVVALQEPKPAEPVRRPSGELQPLPFVRQPGVAGDESSPRYPANQGGHRVFR